MAISTLPKFFLTIAALGVAVTSSMSMSMSMSLASDPAPARSTACKDLSKRPASASNGAIITREQLAFDLCFLASQFPTKNPAPGEKPFSHDVREPLEDMMRQIALEGSLLAECPKGFATAAGPSAAASNFAELHQYGCGPTPSPKADGAYGSLKPSATSFATPFCPAVRPTPTPAPALAPRSEITLFATQHPPVQPKAAIFDLCQASLRVGPEQPQGKLAPLSNAEIERYLFRLAIDVDLALTCGNGRADVNGKLINKAPDETNPDYIKTRHSGCQPAIP